ncbi:methyl-accepting chemotaxis protein [Paenalcaligenes hominis]|uniref:Methyl-accepting chemotaxis protein n=1 Tax=Paenalcaligenes hominis TaxID=643674 RepID=A0ABX0WTN8_9BURK|nr:methyl-accepting chemotaxis protein [Paenalcaligenes hominis]NJB66117.1 methyl-accepting chemotaxis protein [Paenalcaligenes hominis]GGE73828.1 chemotaxis methyl-accepting membrane protein [Paenalcaligenes hominis]
MSFLTRFSVKTKLLIGFLLISVIGALIGLVGWLSLNNVNHMSERMYSYETLGIRDTAEAHVQLVAVGRELRGLFLASSLKERQQREQTIQQLFQQLENTLALGLTRFASAEGQSMVKQLQDEVAAYKKHVGYVLAQIKNEPFYEESDLTAYIGAQVVTTGDRAEQMMERLVTRKESAAHAYNAEIASVFGRSLGWLIGFTAIGVALGLALGLLLAHHLMCQLGAEPVRLRQVANAIAAGDLTDEVESTQVYPQSVMYSIAQMQVALRGIVSNVRSSTQQMAVGLEQIAKGNLDLCQRTDEQAANVTETASAVNQIASTLHSNAASSKEATQLTGVVRASAISGQDAVQATIASMQEIKNASEKITNILGVIDSIAFQTNILALNAAVEAARAGTEGRGFAVVASEVRTLAQRSATAAQEIKALIEQSAATVEVGWGNANEAGAAIEKMVTQVKQVTTLIDEISTATLEQSMGVEQVNQAVSQLDSVTQHNASLVEQSTAATTNLNEQAEHLVRLVSVFKLSGATQASLN